VFAHTAKLDSMTDFSPMCRETIINGNGNSLCTNKQFYLFSDG